MQNQNGRIDSKIQRYKTAEKNEVLPRISAVLLSIFFFSIKLLQQLTKTTLL